MSNIEIYNNAFIDVFGVDESALGAEFTAENVADWDSMRKLNLLNTLEDEFDIMLDPADMLEFMSYESGKAILARYDISL